ncbi:MAG: hypothetical protein VXZ38_02530 [Planctomycetota bacterium]|nr:hypothetical protein [Planctomycetota bacterium]
MEAAIIQNWARSKSCGRDFLLYIPQPEAAIKAIASMLRRLKRTENDSYGSFLTICDSDTLR